MLEKDALIVKHYNFPINYAINLIYGMYMPFAFFPFHMEISPCVFGEALRRLEWNRIFVLLSHDHHQLEMIIKAQGRNSFRLTVVADGDLDKVGYFCFIYVGASCRDE
jgi:hypothetical protein